VSLAEVVTCVNVALGNLGVFACPACDASASGVVEINELQTAVLAVLSGCGSDSFEPDESAQRARTIRCGDSQQHTLAPVGDADWMVLSLSGLSAVVIDTHGPEGDPIMGLLDAALNPLEYNDDFFGPFPHIARVCGQNALPAGDYYITMSGMGGQIVPQYGIAVTCEPCTIANPTLTPTATPTPLPEPDDYEPDNTLEAAQPIACGDVQTHSFAGGGYDEDWVTFAVEARTTVHVLASAAFQEVSLDLRASDGSALEYGYGTLQRDCGVDALGPGTYAVHTSGYELGAYSLALVCRPCGVDNPTDTPTPTFTPTATPIPPDPFEDDDTRDSAVPVACGEAILRSIGPVGDTDWLVLDVPERSSVTIRAYGYPPAIALQDDRGRDLDYQSGLIVRACGSNALDAGRYFVELYGPYPAAAAYDLLVTCEPCGAPNPPTMAPPTRTPTPTPLRPDSYEPDDSSDDANDIGCGMLQAHSLDTRFDQDWVTFTLASDSAVVLLGSSVSLTLFDATGQALFDGYNAFEYTCQQPLPGGSYTLRAACLFCEGPVVAYNLSLLCGACVFSPTPTPTPTPLPG
jgi:hypothetical protein